MARGAPGRAAGENRVRIARATTWTCLSSFRGGRGNSVAGAGSRAGPRKVTQLTWRSRSWHTRPSSVLQVEDLTPSQRGAAAEAAITAMVIQLGLTVLRPLCEGRRYDLVIDLEPELLRVQCKVARSRSGVLIVGL